MSNSSYINALVRSLYDESQEHNDSTLSIKAHCASRVIIKKDNKKVTKILAGRQAAVKSHVFVTEMAKILAAKQQKVPIKDNVVVKNSKHAKRMAAFHRKQEEDAQQTMPMANNIAFVGPTKAEVNEWFHDKKKEKQEEAEYIYQAFKAWHKFSPDEAPPECFYVSISNGLRCQGG